MIYIYNRDEEQIDILDIKPKFTREIGKFNTLEFETIKEYEKGYRVVYQYKGKSYEFIIQEQDYLRDDMVSFSYFCKDSFVENEGVPILDKRPEGSYKVALNSVLEDTRWELVTGSDFSETLTFFNSFYQVSVLEAFAEIVGKYNLEFETSFTFTGSKITSRKIHIKKLGEKANSRLEFGKNIVKFERKILPEKIVTALYGYGKGEETESGGFGRRISFADINGGLAYVTNEEARLKYGIGPVGAKKHIFGFFIDEEETDKTKLLESTRKELERVSQPQAEYTIEAVNLHIDCDYADTVPVLDEEINFSGETRIVKAIVEGDDLIFIFGHVTKGFTDSFQKEIQKSAEATEIKITSIMETRLNQIADVYFGEDGYNYDLKVGNEYNLPAGLYSFDAPIDENPTKVIYFGAGKLLIADSKATDGGWAWKTALDGQGIVGSSIVAHSITANQLAADVGQSLKLSSNTAITNLVSDVSALDGRLDSAELKITPTAITQTVESNTTALATKADVQTSAENWTEKFSQIGGRNLLLNSSELTLDGGNAVGISRRINEEGHLEITAEDGNANYASGLGITLTNNHDLKDGDIITVSIQMKSVNATGTPDLYLGLGMNYKELEGEVTEEFSTIKYTRVWNYRGGWKPHIGFRGRSGVYVFKNIKLEKGNVATDWTPAPEDIEADLGALAKDIEGVQADVAPIREEFESLRTQTASQISEMITKTVFDSNNAEVSGKILAVEKEVDNLEIKFSNSGGINLIKDGKYPTNWSPYDGSTITEYPNQSVPNWDTTKAVNVIASSGNKTGQIKAYKNLMPIGFDVAGSIYTVSIYVKNMRDDAVLWVSVNGLDAPNQWVGRREEKRLIFTGAYDGTRTLQVLLRGQTEAYAVNCLVYQLMVERGAVAHDWSQHPDELVAGATKINEEGVHVYGADGDGGVHTVTKPEGFFIYDGEGRPIQEVNAEESKISKANILDLYTPTAPRRIYETYDVYTDSSSYGDGSGDSWENRSDNITQAIRNVSGGAGAEFLSRYAIINVNVYGVTNEIVRIAGLVGDGELNLLGREGQLISGAIKVMHCTIPINLKAINIRYETNTESDACILANNNRQLIIQGGNLYGKGTAKGIRAVNSNVRANNVGMFDLSELASSTTMANVTLNACRGSNNVNGGQASLGGILSYIQGYPSLSETGNFTASSSGLVLGLKVETGGGSTTTKPVIAERKLTTVSKTFTAQLSTRTSGDTNPWLYDALRQGRWSGKPKPYVGILRFGTYIYDWLKEGGGYSGTPTATITAYRSKGIGSGSVALKISNDVVITTGGVALGGQATSSLSSTAVARIISSSPVTLWTTTSSLSDYAEFYKVTIRVTAQKYL